MQSNMAAAYVHRSDACLIWGEPCCYLELPGMSILRAERHQK
jgi:hypothetical protein